MPPEKAGNFILKDQFGNDFELYKNLDKKILLIFYPKDKSMVCSRQLNNYQKNIELFEAEGIRPVGINIESPDSHMSFCNSLNINFSLLSDEGKKVSKSLNALNLFSVNKRKLVLIGNSGEILYRKTVPGLIYINAEKIIDELRAKQII